MNYFKTLLILVAFIISGKAQDSIQLDLIGKASLGISQYDNNEMVLPIIATDSGLIVKMKPSRWYRKLQFDQELTFKLLGDSNNFSLEVPHNTCGITVTYKNKILSLYNRDGIGVDYQLEYFTQHDVKQNSLKPEVHRRAIKTHKGLTYSKEAMRGCLIPKDMRTRYAQINLKGKQFNLGIDLTSASKSITADGDLTLSYDDQFWIFPNERRNKLKEYNYLNVEG